MISLTNWAYEVVVLAHEVAQGHGDEHRGDAAADEALPGGGNSNLMF